MDYRSCDSYGKRLQAPSSPPNIVASHLCGKMTRVVVLLPLKSSAVFYKSNVAQTRNRYTITGSPNDRNSIETHEDPSTSSIMFGPHSFLKVSEFP